MRRSSNQDAVAISPGGSDGSVVGDTFLMVADGMGAHAAGELASKLASDTVPHAYAKSRGEAAPVALRRAIRRANEVIHLKGTSSPEFHGMGTTCSCLVLTQGAALVGHVGDSRVYRLRGGALEQLTFDHSLVWEMAAASKMSEDRVPACIPKNVITRSLGPHETVMVDLEGPHELRHGDVFLLCSDGLSGVVDDPLAGSLLAALRPAEAADALVNVANLRGGPDNISVIVAEVEAAPGSEAKSPANDTATIAPPKPAAAPKVVGWAGWVGGAAAAIACAAGGAVALAGESLLGAILAAVGFGATVAYAFTRRPGAGVASAPRLAGDALGNGPYRRVEVGDHSAAAGDLRDLVRDLAALDPSESPDEATAGLGDAPPQANGAPRGPALDWTPFLARQEAAENAYRRGDYRLAVAGYAVLIAAVIDRLRGDDGTHRYPARDGVLS